MHCSLCDKNMDRDLNAALNIAKLGKQFQPVKQQEEENQQENKQYNKKQHKSPSRTRVKGGLTRHEPLARTINSPEVNSRKQYHLSNKNINITQENST
jgi:hypothetical protein